MRTEHIISNESKIDFSEDVVLYKGEIYSYLATGTTRKVFVNDKKTKVIKFHIDDRHIHDFNAEEADIYADATDDHKSQMAKTVISDGIIEQEYVIDISIDNRKRTIPQILFSTASRNEVGWTEDGRLVCYDLSEYRQY